MFLSPVPHNPSSGVQPASPQCQHHHCRNRCSSSSNPSTRWPALLTSTQQRIRVPACGFLPSATPPLLQSLPQSSHMSLTDIVPDVQRPYAVRASQALPVCAGTFQPVLYCSASPFSCPPCSTCMCRSLCWERPSFPFLELPAVQ